MKSITLRPLFGAAKDVSVHMAGTLLAQLVLVVATPFLARMYSPELFGEFAIYMVVLGLLSIIATAKYENAIYLVRGPLEGERLVALTAVLSVCTAGLSVLAITIFFILGVEDCFQSFAPWAVMTIPLAMLLAGNNQLFMHYGIYKREYISVAIATLLASLVNMAVALTLGSIGISQGLLIAYLCGQLALVFYYYAKFAPRLSFLLSWKRHMHLIKKYKEIPKNLAPGAMINTLSANLPLMAISSNFGPSLAGQYAIAVRLVSAPIGLLGSSLGAVFRQRAALRVSSGSDCFKLFLRVLFFVSAVAVIPAVILGLYGDILITSVLGSEWVSAGEIAKIFAPMLFLRLLMQPVSGMLLVTNKTHLDLFWQIGFLATASAAFVITSSFHSIILYIVASASFWYVISIFLNFRAAASTLTD